MYFWYFVLAMVALFLLWRVKKMLTKKNLAGQRVLITGAASGIGRRMAFILADMGCKIVILDINQDGLTKVAAELKAKNAEVSTYQVDLSQREQIYTVCDQVLAKEGKVDILINNAGIVSGKKFLETSDEMCQKTLDVNIGAHFWLCKKFLPPMIAANKGHLVTIASMAGHVATAGLADYCASKFATVGFDEAIRVELRAQGHTGVKTTCVCPYYINTGMFEGVTSKFPAILPILDEKYVAETIINAVRMEDEMVMMPKFFWTLPLIRALPMPLQAVVFDAFGGHESMTDFKGRAAGTKKQQ
jgi:all-trans-retinol dehydrogenase (NAD+)